MNKSLTLDEFLEQGYVFSGGEDEGGGDDGGGDSGFVGSDGTFNDGWTNGEAFKDNAPSLSVFKNVTDLANSFVATKKKLGKNPDSLVEIPTDTSSDEVRAAFRKANGVPDNVDAYEYTLSDELAVKLGPLQDDRMTKARKFAHEELGLSPAKFTKLLDFYHNDLAENIDEFGKVDEAQKAEKTEAAKAELKKLWLGDYDAKVQRAQSVMEKYGGVDAVAESNLQNSPTMIKFLDNIAESMSEDTLKGLTVSTGMTADNINTQIADLRSQQNVIRQASPVNFKSDPKFKDLEKRLKGLYQQKPKKTA